VGSAREFLLLHRAHQGPDYEGEWAWTPPSGARHRGESIEACAQRELKEETGLDLAIEPVPGGPADWPIFRAEVVGDVEIALSAEHDRWQWASYEQALSLCQPQQVAAGIKLVAAENA